MIMKGCIKDLQILPKEIQSDHRETLNDQQKWKRQQRDAKQPFFMFSTFHNVLQ